MSDSAQHWHQRPAEGSRHDHRSDYLPDQLAEAARNAGLLTPAALERSLRQQLQAREVDELFVAMERMAAVDDPAALSPQELAEDLHRLRAKRRAVR